VGSLGAASPASGFESGGFASVGAPLALSGLVSLLGGASLPVAAAAPLPAGVVATGSEVIPDAKLLEGSGVNVCEVEFDGEATAPDGNALSAPRGAPAWQASANPHKLTPRLDHAQLRRLFKRQFCNTFSKYPEVSVNGFIGC
jgi:hypothetical protein